MEDSDRGRTAAYLGRMSHRIARAVANRATLSSTAEMSKIPMRKPALLWSQSPPASAPSAAAFVAVRVKHV